jgi:hypothetical protein
VHVIPEDSKTRKASSSRELRTIHGSIYHLANFMAFVVPCTIIVDDPTVEVERGVAAAGEAIVDVVIWAGGAAAAGVAVAVVTAVLVMVTVWTAGEGEEAAMDMGGIDEAAAAGGALLDAAAGEAVAAGAGAAIVESWASRMLPSIAPSAMGAGGGPDEATVELVVELEGIEVEFVVVAALFEAKSA